MTDNDQSSAAARRPYRQNGDSSSSTSDRRPSAWTRLRALLSPRSATLRSDLQTALSEPATDGEESFSSSERTIIDNVLKLSDMRVEDVMVPRADIEAVEVSSTLAQAIARFRTVGHSRLPIYEESLDKVVGMIHIKDVLDRITEVTANPAASGNGTAQPIKLVSAPLRQKLKGLDIIRQVLFVPTSMPITDLLQSMQATHIHMAVIVDEYGGTDGLATIEDLLEAVVGDIEDEHDEDEGTLLRQINENTYLADARIELDDLVSEIGEDFDPGEWKEEVDTLGGLVFALAGRVPARGEIIAQMDGWDFEITRSDARRVRQVKIVRGRRNQPMEALPSPESFAAAETATAPTDEKAAS